MTYSNHYEVPGDRTGGTHAEQIIAAANDPSEMGARARATDRVDRRRGVRGRRPRDAPGRGRIGGRKAGGRRGDRTPGVGVGGHERLGASHGGQQCAGEAVDYANSAVTLRLEDRPDELVVVDSDGPGVPDEELVPIRVGTETALQHSRGLGLWQLGWSVDELGGELAFDTTDGTTIRITIPDRSGATRVPRSPGPGRGRASAESMVCAARSRRSQSRQVR